MKHVNLDRAGVAVVTCLNCGFEREIPRRPGRYPSLCQECAPNPAARARARELREGRIPRPRIEHSTACEHSVNAFLKLLHHCELRLAVESAVALLRMGRARDALDELEQAAARGRVIDLNAYSKSV